MDLITRVASHYEVAWKAPARSLPPTEGRLDELPAGFTVLEFPPGPVHESWTYASCGSGAPRGGPKDPGLEFFIYSPECDPSVAELLYAVVSYHWAAAPLWFGHTVNLGRPWLDESSCTFGLLSSPYLESQSFWRLPVKKGGVEFAWLVPITEAERDFKKQRGLDALETIFEQRGIRYLDPQRESLV